MIVEYNRLKFKSRQKTAKKKTVFNPIIWDRLYEPKKRNTPDRAQGSSFSAPSYWIICLH